MGRGYHGISRLDMQAAPEAVLRSVFGLQRSNLTYGRLLDDVFWQEVF